jgi:Na+-driven multidrug efflux pump
MFALTFWNGRLLAGIYLERCRRRRASADYLKAYAVDCPLVALLFCMIGYCNGNGKTLFTMLQGIFCAFAVRIPLAYVFSRLGNGHPVQVGLATPAATFVVF